MTQIGVFNCLGRVAIIVLISYAASTLFSSYHCVWLRLADEEVTDEV